MELKDELTLALPQQTVWQALNDADVLRQCIPGCTELAWTEDHRLDAKLTIKVGPIKVNFAGVVTLTEVAAPDSYVLLGEGKGGAAGFAKGVVGVALRSTDAAGTVLSYSAKVDVGGKLAQIGSRLLDSTSRKFAAEFFDRFSTVVGCGPAALSTSAEGS